MELGWCFGCPPSEPLPPLGNAEVCKISLLCICEDAGGHPKVRLEHHGFPGRAESLWWPLQGLGVSWGTVVAAPHAQLHPGNKMELFQYRFSSGAFISQKINCWTTDFSIRVGCD